MRTKVLILMVLCLSVGLFLGVYFGSRSRLNLSPSVDRTSTKIPEKDQSVAESKINEDEPTIEGWFRKYGQESHPKKSLEKDESVIEPKAEVVSLFEKQVDKFEKFFSSNPKSLEKQSYRGSPTGYIFFYERVDYYKISYDIRKSDSLVSPYMGYITLSYWSARSTNCGDFNVNSPFGGHYFTTLDLARQKRDDESCYQKPKDLEFVFKFIFAFQKQKWVYKEVINGYTNKPVAFFKTAGEFYVEDNDFWMKLIE